MFKPMFKIAIFLVIIWCCSFYKSHGCLEEERVHLLQIKDSINYPHGSYLDEYWVGKNCCNWSGIQCNSSSSRVIAIYLPGIREERLALWYPNASLFAAFKELEELDLEENLIGGWVAPQAFSEMQSLRTLYLLNNNLAASIDSLRGLCELKNLRDLDLTSNNLDGRALPPCLSKLSKLETLWLQGNDLGSTSSALTGLCGLSALKSLYLSGNHLDDGSFPMCMGNFSLLENLDLARNNLSGHFGNSISGLKRLHELDLSSNHLTDDGISTWISNLTSLISLRLEYNKLKGSDAIRGLCELENLRDLYLGGNNLDGRALPPCLSNLSMLETLSLEWNDLGSYSSSLTGLCKLKNLRALYLDRNNLDGRALPPCLSKLSKLETLWLQDNDLGSYSSALTGLCGLTTLKSLDLSDNHFDDSSLPMCMENFSILENLDLSRNNLSGHFGNSISGLKQLQELYLESNQLTDDGISPWISNLTSLAYLHLENNKLKESDTMRGLCGLSALTTLYLYDNYLSSLPICMGNFSLLENLDLSWNNLSSLFGNSIPGLCGLSALTSLNLNDNYLSSLPICMGNFSLLENLDLSGNNLSSLFGNSIPGLKRLQSLDLQSNQLTDDGISSWISNLTSLTELNLGNNKLKDSDTIRGLCGLSALKLLYLYNNHLSSLPMCMGNFSLLEELDLSHNNLSGLFGSGVPGLKRLKFLDLGSNHLTDDGISPWISNLTSLTNLYLENNTLKGSDNMRGFCTLRNLRGLVIGGNSIGASINPCFGNMQNLAYLNLHRNQLKGTIPSSIFSNLTMLTGISISQNQFNGLFSFSTFANLSELSYVDISENIQLEVETETVMWVPTFQLSFLLLNNCILNKRTGHGMPTFISTQQSLYILELGHTSLKGTIPSWLLYNVTINGLSLKGNFLEGPFPKSTQHNMSSLQYLDISNNDFSGKLPPDIDTIFPNLVTFNMSTNELQGAIPLSLSKLQKLETMDLSQNKLFGEMPEGLVGNNTSLKYLKLSNNELHGNILSKNWNMTELVVLLLDNNKFTGTIASNMLRSPSLIVLDLRGNKLSGFIPSWLPSLGNLSLLLLGDNFFDGSIPIQLCQLQNLHILDLSSNKISGSIPSCLSNISSWMEEIPIQIDESLGPQFERYIAVHLGFYSSYPIYIRVKTNLNTKGLTLTYEGLPFSLMTSIDLSMNQLIGSIPLQMGKLKELRSLNLSHNLLSGPFPESFQSLENIESLDLSHNKLAGMIPPQITQLYSLSSFSVAFNNLSGVIPYEKQFLTFNESSYTGNHDLCGPPLPWNCSSNNPSQTRDNKEEEEEDNSEILDSPMFFYSLVAISYALGFWSFIALICNKNRRESLFRTVDRCYDWVYVNFQLFQLYLKRHCN